MVLSPSPAHTCENHAAALERISKAFSSSSIEDIACLVSKLDEGGENVRRRTEVKEPKGQWERSIYAVRLFL